MILYDDKPTPIFADNAGPMLQLLINLLLDGGLPHFFEHPFAESDTTHHSFHRSWIFPKQPPNFPRGRLFSADFWLRFFMGGIPFGENWSSSRNQLNSKNVAFFFNPHSNTTFDGNAMSPGSFSNLAFTTGRIVVLSDLPEGQWMYDYRFLEVAR